MKCRNLLLPCLLLLFVLGLSYEDVTAQGVTLPQVSPKAKVKQTVGITEIGIAYSRPNVVTPQGQDRTGQIWGKVVPYGMNNLGFGTATSAPWRAGANENTVIWFSTAVKVEGKDLPAGKYGLHVEVKEYGGATVIFSKDISSWGSFFYDEKRDALRVNVQTEEIPNTKLLTFHFPEVTIKSATIALDWEKKRIPIKIETDTPELTYASLKEELKSSTGFTHQNWNQAAGYLLQNNIHLDEALQWSESAISAPFIGQKTFGNMQLKSQILTAMSKTAEADKVMANALNSPSATANDYYGYGRALIGQDKDKEALAIFMKLNKKWPEHWLAPHGLARGYSATGDFKKALKYEQTALGKAPQGSKQFLEGYIATLKEGKDFN